MKHFGRIKEARSVCFDQKGGTISISTSNDGDADALIDLSPQGMGQDDKALGFDHNSFRFVVRILEQVTGYRFKPVKEDRFCRTSIPI